MTTRSDSWLGGGLAYPFDGWLVPAEWWCALVPGGAAASTLGLVLFSSPGLLVGLAINGAFWRLMPASVSSPMSACGVGIGAG